MIKQDIYDMINVGIAFCIAVIIQILVSATATGYMAGYIRI